MSLTEFDEKEFIEMIRNEGREEAHDEGFAEGFSEGHDEGQELFASLVKKLYADGRESDVLNVSLNKSFRTQLMKEYALI